MQRLGFLKPLCALVNETETSNLANLGKRFMERVSKRVRQTTPVDEQVRDYARSRMTDGIFRELRKTILEGPPGMPVPLEVQDLYLADPLLPSNTGRLVEANWRRYPYLGTSLELVRKGTYSALTRSLVLLAVTPKEELRAFPEYDRRHNPMRISDAQAIVLLFCLLDNDAEVVFPLFRRILDLDAESFDERVAGEFLPEIFRQVAREHENRSLTVEERERLASLTKTATSIEQWKGKPYSGGGAGKSRRGCGLNHSATLDSSANLTANDTNTGKRTLSRPYFTSGRPRGIRRGSCKSIFLRRLRPVVSSVRRPANDDEAREALVDAGKTLKSALGFSPITDVGILASVRLLTEKALVLELASTSELLKRLQKRDPGFVRFTVDRTGAMAHVKFLKALVGAENVKNAVREPFTRFVTDFTMPTTIARATPRPLPA